MSSRAGEYVAQEVGYRAYVPRDLPPTPPLTIDRPLWGMLCEAEWSLGRLSGYAESLEDPDGLAELALRTEAANSARLDGAAVSLTDLLRWQLDGPRGFDQGAPTRGEVKMAANSVDAAGWGLSQVARREISLELMMQLHTRLFEGLRGRDRGASQLRTSEIWLGPSGSTAATAAYVPPPPAMVPGSMAALERFILSDAPLPPLVGAALIYYQLETIHPFVDGNGRLARLMIPLILSREGVGRTQLLSLSASFGRDRAEHFRRLQLVRERGEWESWVAYFLRGIRSAAEAAVSRLSGAEKLRRRHRQLVEERLGGSSAPALCVVDSLLVQPLVSVASVARIAGRTFANANLLVQRLEEMGLLTELTGRRRNRRFCCEAYVRLLEG